MCWTDKVDIFLKKITDKLQAFDDWTGKMDKYFPMINPSIGITMMCIIIFIIYLMFTTSWAFLTLLAIAIGIGIFSLIYKASKGYKKMKEDIKYGIIKMKKDKEEGTF